MAIQQTIFKVQCIVKSAQNYARMTLNTKGSDVPHGWYHWYQRVPQSTKIQSFCLTPIRRLAIGNFNTNAPVDPKMTLDTTE